MNKGPIVMELEAGEYYWCKCGKTGKSPFCDGSHRGSDITPVTFTLTAKKEVPLCSCQKTKTAPYCDGSHAK